MKTVVLFMSRISLPDLWCEIDLELQILCVPNPPWTWVYSGTDSTKFANSSLRSISIAESNGVLNRSATLPTDICAASRALPLNAKAGSLGVFWS